MEPFSEGENETDVLKRILKESKEMGKHAGGKSETSIAKAGGPGSSGVGRGSRKRESPTTRGRGRDPRGRGEKGMAAASVGRGRKPAGSQEAKLNRNERNKIKNEQPKVEDSKESRPLVEDKSQAEDAKEEIVEKPDQQLNEEGEDDKK